MKKLAALLTLFVFLSAGISYVQANVTTAIEINGDKGGDKKKCEKDKACCSKKGEKESCSKKEEGAKPSCSKSGEKKSCCASKKALEAPEKTKEELQKEDQE